MTNLLFFQQILTYENESESSNSCSRLKFLFWYLKTTWSGNEPGKLGDVKSTAISSTKFLQKGKLYSTGRLENQSPSR